MDAAGCHHRSETGTSCPACEIDALRRELTEAQSRLKGWTNHAELAEHVIAELRLKLADHDQQARELLEEARKQIQTLHDLLQVPTTTCN
jgi:predicted  nucleic acid-binding Zn-ribbon protein